MLRLAYGMVRNSGPTHRTVNLGARQIIDRTGRIWAVETDHTQLRDAWPEWPGDPDASQ